jgi:hypothetical protein
MFSVLLPLSVSPIPRFYLFPFPVSVTWTTKSLENNPAGSCPAS